MPQEEEHGNSESSSENKASTLTNDFSDMNEEKNEAGDEIAKENEDEKAGVNENEKDMKKNEEAMKESEDFSPEETSEKIHSWFKVRGWKKNPFVLSIIPSVFVGYDSQKQKLISCVEQKHKLCLIVGATGSGKTTALRWLAEELKSRKDLVPVFISKPPSSKEEFVEIFNKELFSLPWYLAFLRPIMPNIKNISCVSDSLNKKFKNAHMVLLCDEIHEANVEVLQWIRVLTDQVENFSLIISGLPVFDEMLKSKLETFQKRITTRVVLDSLSEEETADMINSRIKYVSKEGAFTNPFTEEAMKEIYRETGGFPREILRLCDKAVNDAIEKNADKINPGFSYAKPEQNQEAGFDLRSIPRRQREIIEAIRTGKGTPSEIIDVISLEKYKSKDHAIRSANNILQRLMKDGLIEREKQGKTFVYALGPKMKSIAVRA